MRTTIFAGLIALMSMTLLIGLFQSRMVTAGQVESVYVSIHGGAR